MPLYPPAIKKLLPLNKTSDPAIKARIAILHVAASEANSLYDWFNGPSGGVESHFYIRYDGTVEQYRDTDYQADANVMANGFAVSIETEGLEAGKWTTAQLNAIKALLLWLHDVESIPLVVPQTWDGSGVGYHILFEDQWDRRHASCPGPNRITQFKTLLVPWMAGATKEVEDVALTADEIQKIALAVWGYKNNDTRDAYEYLRNGVSEDTWLRADVIPAPWSDASNPTWTAASVLSYLYRMTLELQAASKTQATKTDVDKLLAAINALPQSASGQVDANAVVEAIRAQWNK